MRVRGTESNHVLVLIDGIKASDPYFGEYDVGTLIADEAAKVEVLRGQQSSRYGSDAIGGVIQYITLTGRELPGISLRAEGGSFGTASGGARLAGYTDTLDYAVSGSAYRTDGTPTARNGTRDIGSTSIGTTAKLNWTPSSLFRLTGVFAHRLGQVDAVKDHHFDAVHAAFIEDEAVRRFMADVNPAALRETAAGLAEALERGLWQPRSNSAGVLLAELAGDSHAHR